MQIIYDDIIYSLQKAGGISVYWSELSKRLTASGEDVVFLKRDCFNNPLSGSSIGGKEKEIKKLIGGIDRYFNLSTGFIKAPHIFHSSYYRLSKTKNALNVVTVHDFTYEKFFSLARRAVHSMQKFRAIKNSDLIICVSENTKKDLLKFLPRINPEKIKVVYNGVSEGFFLTQSKDCGNSSVSEVLQEKYVLYVGQRAEYKNFASALEAMRFLPNKFKLVCVGAEFTPDEKEDVKKFSGRIRHIKFPSESELNLLYNNAFCLVYPSLYEGFGIPVAEAMKCGCPVIACNSSSIPEVAGGAAILLENITPKEIADAVLGLENVNARNDKIKQGLTQSKKFSWDKCFSQTSSLYKQLSEGANV